MDATARLAGFFAAHAVWCVSEGDVLVPLLAVEDSAGARSLQRFVAESYEDAVGQARERMAQNPDNAACAALFFDAFITLEAGQTDAIIVHARAYESPAFVLEMAVPYRNASSDEGFGIYKPVFLGVEGVPEQALERIGELFFLGVDSHEKGAEIWSDAAL